jgi:hypothetical protein
MILYILFPRSPFRASLVATKPERIVEGDYSPSNSLCFLAMFCALLFYFWQQYPPPPPPPSVGFVCVSTSSVYFPMQLSFSGVFFPRLCRAARCTLLSLGLVLLLPFGPKQIVVMTTAFIS